MKSLPVLAITVSALALAACASDGVPTIAYDDDFRPAARIPEPPRPVRIVEVPKPLPLPGQLLRVSTRVSPDSRPPTRRVDDANRSATQEPTRRGYINALQVYPFVEGALYRLYAAPELVSDIALQPGETLTAVSAGDTVRWVIGDTTSGTGSDKRVHVLVKPFAAGLDTNLIVTTDRRTYHLRLESTEKTAMAAISWTYPADGLVALRRGNAEAEAALPVTSGVNLEDLRFRYDISGDDPPWRPLRVFDDGRKVYIEFPRRIDQGEAPPLFVLGPAGDAQLVNYRMAKNYYVVDRLFAAAELRLGGEPQQVVRIARDDVKVAHRPRSSGGERP